MSESSEPDTEILAALVPYAEKAGRTPEEMLALITRASDQAIKRAAREAEREAARAQLTAELATLPKLAGITDIAAWFDVNRAAVGNWLSRFSNWPRPAYATNSSGYQWLDNAATREAWESWYENKT